MDPDEIWELFFLICCAYITYMNCMYAIMDYRLWTREIYSTKERELRGFFKKCFKVIKERDEGEFRKATRMSVREFDVLLNLLKNRLEKFSQREPIEPECRLALTLLYLSQGAPRQVLAWSFQMGVSTVQSIIYEPCEAIWEELRSVYLSVPNETELSQIADLFYTISGMPNCVGAIDGKHINIVCPPNAGSEYYNYKGHHSIVLLAACDARYCFTYVEIGAQGSRSDGGVFALSSFGKMILESKLPLPADRALPDSDIVLPYFFVADAAFPLKKNVMRPYPGRALNRDREIFNYKLSAARRIIENTFGIMCARWRILNNSLHCHPKNADKIIKAIVILHNYVKLNDQAYCPENYVDHYHDENLIPG